MTEPAKWIAYAMVGFTVIALVGAIVLKLLLTPPASPVCDHLQDLSGGEKVVERMQRYLGSHGRVVPDSCRDIVEAMDREMEDAQFSRLTDCLTKAATADAGVECVSAIGTWK
jgi:hypothetical protein